MPSEIAVGTNSWISDEDAESYFDDRLNADVWTELTDPSDDYHASKKRALITAYKQLNSGIFSGLPGTVSQNMKDAQCEQALFLLQHGSDADARKGIQAQGVVAAGVVKEQYDVDRMNKTPICAAAMELLKEYYKPVGSGFFSGAAERDEDS